MKKILLLFSLVLGICLSGHSATTERLLILTEPTAQENLKAEFPAWLKLVKSQTNFSEVIIRTHPRWVGNWVTNDWNLLNKMSNDIAYFNPKAVLIIGRLPYMVGGSWNPDGHENRCFASDAWLGISNFAFVDTATWPMSGYTPSGYPLNQNIPGDGRPDQITGTKLRWVGRIDLSNLPYMSDSGVFSGGCLDGLQVCPAVDEGIALRAYFTNNIAYRTGRWTTSATGIMTGVLWNYSSPSFGYRYITNLNRSVTWTGSSSPIPGGNVRFYYDNWDDKTQTQNLYDGSCVPTRGLVAFRYRSYAMEVYRGYNPPFRRLAPGRQMEPYFLVSVWSDAGPSWFAKTTDKYIGDIIDTSTAVWGYWHLGLNFYGDITLPFVAENSPVNSMSVNELRTN